MLLKLQMKYLSFPYRKRFNSLQEIVEKTKTKQKQKEQDITM